MKTQKQSKKEQLELLEKKVEIQKKRMEIKKEMVNIDEIIGGRKIALDEQKSIIDKISVLSTVLTEYTIDNERTILGSEPYLVPIITGKNREILTSKLLELVKVL